MMRFYTELIGYRVGGTENNLVLNDSLVKANRLVEQLQSRIRDAPFFYGNQRLEVTISVGVAQLYQKQSAVGFYGQTD